MENIKTLSDMYFISILIAYGFEVLNVDRENADSQRYSFSLEEVRKVYTIHEYQPQINMLNVEEVESVFISNRLLAPPNYVQTLKSVKYSIMSTRYGAKNANNK